MLALRRERASVRSTPGKLGNRGISLKKGFKRSTSLTTITTPSQGDYPRHCVIHWPIRNTHTHMWTRDPHILCTPYSPWPRAKYCVRTGTSPSPPLFFFNSHIHHFNRLSQPKSRQSRLFSNDPKNVSNYFL